LDKCQKELKLDKCFELLCYNIIKDKTMEKLKQYKKKKIGQRALWTILNSFMAMVVALIAFLATENIGWAVMVLPIAQAVSQYITKEIINK